MELTAVLINLQGILTRLYRTTDSLAKLKYKGGNEMKISRVVKEIETFLKKEKCIIDDEFNEEKESTIRDIVFFLALNCEFKEEPEMDGYEHLMAINLKLSTCLFANVVTELRLVGAFVATMDKFSFNVQTEFLQEFLICFKKTDASLNLGFSHSIVTSVIKQVNEFSSSDRKLNEDVEGLVEVSTEILDILRGLNVEQVQLMKTDTIYQEMGFKLLKLLQLLFLCDPSKEHLAPLIRNVVNISCDITAAVTVDVFCEWAEVEENGEPLQAAVASVAYHVMNKFRGYQSAKQLLMMLGTIARKPKSVQELIRFADAAKIVQMIEREDENQKQWFQALFHTQIFSDEKSMACVEKYYRLCGEAEVERILNFCRGKEVDEKKINLVLKCVSIIPLSRLIILITRYFHSYGIHTALNSKINKEKLVLLLNKIEDSEQYKKDILLLLLQNLKEVLFDLYRECLKNAVYSTQLKSIFSDFKEILVVGNASLICLEPLITQQVLLENQEQLTTLLKTLIETKCIKYDTAINEVIIPQLAKFVGDDGDKTFPLGAMIILNELYLPNKLENPEKIINVVFAVLCRCRCRSFFYDYDVIKHNITKECVKFLLKCEECSNLRVCPADFKEGSIEQYYANKVSCKLQGSLFDFLFPHVDVNGDGYYELVSKLVTVLPTYVADEWKEVASALQAKSGTENTVKALTDALLSLSTFADGEKQNDLTMAFISCLNSYMISIKDLQQSNIEDQIIITKHVCRLLRHLKPKEQEQAQIITGLISHASLKLLFEDRDFMNGFVAIGNKNICQLLAYKTLNS